MGRNRKGVCLLLSLILAVATALGTGFTVIAAAPAEPAATQSVELTIHYFRYEQDYTEWNVWVWADGKEGAAVKWTGEDSYGKVAITTVAQVSAEKQGIGFIVRKGNWADKDVPGDRFVPVSRVVDGKAEIYLIEGDVNIYYAIEDADTSAKLLTAAFSNVGAVKATVTEKLSAENKEDFALYADGILVPSTVTGKAGTKTVSLKFADPVDFSKAYSVRSGYYGEIGVSMENIYDTKEFNDQFQYDGELGALYSPSRTEFRLWAPTASKVECNRYGAGSGDNLIETVPMTRGDKGVWSAAVSGNLDKTYYTYSVTVNGVAATVVDPYAKSAGVNGERGMVLDLNATDPAGWSDQRQIKHVNKTDAIIYESHIRDFTIDPSSGVSEANRGKYLGLTEKGTKNAAGLSTGLDHLVELGITELHILPMFDYSSVDESDTVTAQFNWGYDPLNYNVPEGSYSSNAAQGEVRVSELKQMVMALHNSGIRVIMDVVYNHTAKSADSNFNKIVPGYYYRMVNGQFSNGSGCGNETASERSMYRKFMTDSVLYWAEEYKIDGFRFDLMGLHDVDTMNGIYEKLHEINDGILIYGEGWTGGTTPLAASKQAVKLNAKKMPNISVFSDDIRDGIKGSVFNAGFPGFVSGALSMEEQIKFGVVGSVPHSQVSASSPWAGSPGQTITYASAHDNLTLWDKLMSSTPGATDEDRVRMNELSAGIVMTCQGIPFFLSGEEILRTKPKVGGGYDENSYQSPDSTNAIKWDTKTENLEVFEYYKGLIAMRKSFPQFRMTTQEDVTENISFFEDLGTKAVGFMITGKTADGKNQDLFVFYNANSTELTVTLPKNGTYEIYADGNRAGSTALSSFEGKQAVVKPIGMLVLSRTYEQGQPVAVRSAWLRWGVWVLCGGVVMAGAAAAALIILKKKGSSAKSR